MTVPDLRPNSQDTSAFYLGSIYGVLTDPNATRASIPSPVAKPPPFSPPRYTVWVNSLWFLSLAIGLSCALLAISLQQWARRYIRLTRAQPAQHSPEKRARIRAFYANGVDKMYVPWAVEGLPTLLHLSLFLFFGGLVIFLFNIDREVFTCVFLWIGLFSMAYGLITLLPLIRRDSPYYTPLSIPVWFLSAILCTAFQVLAILIVNFVTIPCSRRVSDRVHFFLERYGPRDFFPRMLGGLENVAEEMGEKESSEIDIRIFDWTIGALKGALGDDNSLEKVFEAIPGFFSSELVKNLERDIPDGSLKTFWDTLERFMGNNLTSSLVTESVKSHRDAICRDIMSMMPYSGSRYFMTDNLQSHFERAPVSIERLQAMARWRTNNPLAFYAKRIIVQKLPRIPKRDGRWIALARDVLGLNLSMRYVSGGGDDASLATLIDICRQCFRTFSSELPYMELVKKLAQIDIRHTLPGLQHEFCALWNDAVQEMKDDSEHIESHINLLQSIHDLYIALHPCTDGAPTEFSSTCDSDSALFQILARTRPSFPLCDIAGHRPDLNAPAVVLDSCDYIFHSDDTESYNNLPLAVFRTPRVVGRGIDDSGSSATTILPSYDRTLFSEIRGSSQLPTTISSALPVHTTQRPADLSSPGAKAAALPPPPPPALPIVSFSIPASPSPSHVPLLPNAGLFALLSSVTPSRPTDNSALPRLRARGLMNAGSICFANAVLHLLVRSPPFWNLFRKLGDLKELHRATRLEAEGGATPLVDATVRFSEEFTFKEEPPPLQQHPQAATEENPREDQGAEKEHDSAHSFEPVYVYDAMKGKRKLKNLLVRSHGRGASFCYSFVLVYCVKDGKHQDAEEFLGLYLDALDEELVNLHAYVSTHKSASTPGVEDLEDEAQSAGGQTEVGNQGYTVRQSFLPY